MINPPAKDETGIFNLFIDLSSSALHHCGTDDLVRQLKESRLSLLAPICDSKWKTCLNSFSLSFSSELKLGLKMVEYPSYNRLSAICDAQLMSLSEN
jgi:hypothetical protein